MKNKYAYSLSSNILFLIKKAWQIDKVLLFSTIIRMPINVLLPMIATYLSKFVAVFHKGQIIQHGSHNQLVSNENGQYYELWNAQAQYYLDEKK